jgi:hypothetical protein
MPGIQFGGRESFSAISLPEPVHRCTQQFAIGLSIAKFPALMNSMIQSGAEEVGKYISR